MLIITLDISSLQPALEFKKALAELHALQVTANTWLLAGQHSASGLMDLLEPLLPDRDNDALFIGNLDAFAELQWSNPLCSDAEVGGLIRLQREGP